MRTIYTDKQTEALLEQIISENPNFNLSGFVKKILVDYQGDNDKDSLDKVRQDIKEAQMDIDKLKERLEYLKDQEVKIMAKDKHAKDSFEDRIEELIIKLLKWYDINEVTADVLAREYDRERHGTITKFMGTKGYSVKE